MRELALHAIDLLENSLEAGAEKIWIRVIQNDAADRLILSVLDDGRGMTAAEANHASSPFFSRKSSRKYGFGLALLEQSAQNAGGFLHVAAIPGKGTHVHVQYRLHHINRPPLGDFAGTLLLAITCCRRPCAFVVQTKRTGCAVQRLETHGERLRADPSVQADLLALFPPELADKRDEKLFELLQKGESAQAAVPVARTAECI